MGSRVVGCRATLTGISLSEENCVAVDRGGEK